MIEKTILALLKQDKTIALVTIIDNNGSAPRLPGSKMVVEQDGTLHGTIGGGKLEFTAHKKAGEVARGTPQIITEFDMRGSGGDGDADMVCGGIQLVLIERLSPEMAPMFARALACFSGGARGVWTIDITDQQHPRRDFVDLQQNGRKRDDIDFQEVMRSRTTRLVRVGKEVIVIDPLPKNGTVVLFGGGHVSREVAGLAVTLDFEVIVCDDRIEFASKSRFPMVTSVHQVDFTNAFAHIDRTENLYLLILTHGHRYDQEVLAQALQTSARYIGMIGSRRKRDIIYENLRKQGFSDADFARVHCPVGLSIGSETPREIAISVIAELIAARAGVL
jgi:xanthine dehydrogenase accessory factor